MKVSFELTMPNVGSWNGQWTGAGRKYYVIRNYRKKPYWKEPSSDRIAEIMEGKPKKSWHYSWNDGWGANVTMEIVDAAEAKRRQKASAGFSGYEWMIDSILECGKILNTNDRKKEKDRMELIEE